MPPAPQGLEVRAFDDPTSLWNDLLGAWRDGGNSQLVLPTPYAQQRFLFAEAAETLWDERAVAVSALTARWRSDLKLPRPLRRLELQSSLTDLLEGPGLPEQLRKLRDSPAAVGRLLSHLNDIEAQADRSYQPQTEVERGIARLRKQMTDRGHLGEVTILSRVAREAKTIDTGRPLLFAPGAGLTPHFTGLLKGLAIHQSVTLWVLTTAGELRGLREPANLLDTQVRENFAGGYASRLFTADRPADRDEHHHWLEAADEAEAAVDLAWAWCQQGVPASDIAIVSPTIEEHAGRLGELATRRGLPIHLRSRVNVNDTTLGALLLRIARAGLNDKSQREALLTGDGERLGLTDEQLDVVAAAVGVLPRMRALHALGAALLTQPGDALPLPADVGRAHAWLGGLAGDLAAYESSELCPTSAEEALMAAASHRLTLGDPAGVGVCDYAEAPGLRFTHAVYLSLHGSGYPPPSERSPFISDGLYAVAPTLTARDRRPEFTAAVAAGGYAAFVRRAGEGDTPGPFWQETIRAATPAEKPKCAPTAIPAPGLGRQRVLQRLARSGVHHALLTDAERRGLRERLPRGVLNGQRDHFSVTELETFLRCPRGWFVGHVLRPAQPPSPAAARGNLLHSVLEGALRLPPDHHRAFVSEALEVAVTEGKLSALEAVSEEQRLVLVLARYSGPDWPFTVHHQEQRLRSENIIPGSVITGRADRIDIGPAGALVIDYKRSRAPRRKSPNERLDELQRYLYPKLAAERFVVEPLGAVYVSVFHGAHDGSLARDIAALSADTVDYDWTADSEVALQRAADAIRRIERGDWEEEGDNCPAWCSHRLISETVRRAA